jgi:hypothetical protein
MKVNVEFSASTSHIVKLVPSTHTKPFGTIYFILDDGTLILDSMGWLRREEERERWDRKVKRRRQKNNLDFISNIITGDIWQNRNLSLHPHTGSSHTLNHIESPSEYFSTMSPVQSTWPCTKWPARKERIEQNNTAWSSIEKSRAEDSRWNQIEIKQNKIKLMFRTRRTEPGKKKRTDWP